MDFREMLYITTVADCQSVTDAAKKLYISQPSLSQIVSKVERDLGVKLFDRNTYPIALTYAGEKYVGTARKILEMNHNLRRELTDIGHGAKGKIRLGIPTERAGYMLPPVLKRFQKEFPQIEIQTIETKTDELIETILKGELDFLILPRREQDLPVGLKTELIYREKIMLVAGSDMIKEEHFLKAEKGAVDLTQIKDMPVILLKRGHAIRKTTNGLFQRYHISPPVLMEISSCISAVLLADSGLGITFVPQRAVEMLGGQEKFCCYRYGKEWETWEVNVVYKEEAYLNRAERRFLDLMKEVFGGV